MNCPHCGGSLTHLATDLSGNVYRGCQTFLCHLPPRFWKGRDAELPARFGGPCNRVYKESGGTALNLNVSYLTHDQDGKVKTKQLVTDSQGILV